MFIFYSYRCCTWSGISTSFHTSTVSFNIFLWTRLVGLMGWANDTMTKLTKECHCIKTTLTFSNIRSKATVPCKSYIQCPLTVWSDQQNNSLVIFANNVTSQLRILKLNMNFSLLIISTHICRVSSSSVCNWAIANTTFCSFNLYNNVSWY